VTAHRRAVRTARIGTVLIVAFVLASGSVVVFASTRPHRRPPGSESAKTSSSRPLDIRFDDEVVDRFLGFVDHGGASPQEIDRWIRLAGNAELLRQGRIDHDLTPDILREAAKVTLEGRGFSGPATLGTLAGGDWELLRGMLAEIRSREDALRVEISEALSGYLPADVGLPPVVIHFHLGGSWDGRTSDAVYVNLTVFQLRGASSLPGLDALLVHEAFHCVQAALLPGIEDYSSRQAALYSVLLRVQQEGIARHIEYRYLHSAAAGNELDSTNLAKYEDGLARLADNAAILATIADRIETGRLDQAHQLASEGLLSGGPLYVVGHAMAMAIQAHGGAPAIARTVAAGPLEFARVYVEAVRAAGGRSLLPDILPARIEEAARGFGRDPLLAARARREGLALLTRGELAEARRVLRQAVRIDPTDAISAYNMACAQALDHNEHRAMRWLEEAFERGFDNYKHVANDSDLESLHDEPRFRALLAGRGFELPGPTLSGSAPAVNP
jgi:tetratricopeptide (TPR) repeat protein